MLINDTLNNKQVNKIECYSNTVIVLKHLQAVGEPPLFLASSVFFAIKEAIQAARKDMGIHDYFKLDAPATSARIRNGCIDDLTVKVVCRQFHLLFLVQFYFLILSFLPLCY